MMAIDFAKAEVEIGWRFLDLAKVDPLGITAHLDGALYASVAARIHLTLVPMDHDAASVVMVARDIDTLLEEIGRREQERGLPGSVTIGLDRTREGLPPDLVR